ncbi:methylated-DNA--[protein]-cysteine S-methyltransferase [Corynebacterium glyciniphilum]|uniref:methylated-DNA--[protein]-cysteine S-methyltransferase n=1 Tax=Corynebacterium glyciniphilum TaxID=1404244 RepID=UPI00264F6B1B|nr:methylated-DNA--[protein]-cysteine S-methyltransferase [Corynebacterium glyciniphilum]MDN5682954.1 methylated-DNA--[protein]-cysteine S-methyltransferase [Corynebacterium glyciniphilum]MDN6706250.1 methylated-DNA--[protein]-cysteine S-methyltransferase [Corynebacterium glyciniphilum]
MNDAMKDLTRFPVDDADLARLRSRLADDAAASDILDVAYRTVDSPIGPLLLAATQKGLVRVAFDLEDFDTVLTALADKVSPRVLESRHRLDAVATELDEYFAGRRQEFDLPLDFAMSSGFRQDVQRYLPHIGYGQTQSYRQVAEGVGNPKAVRAVGTACATNPLPVVVPCHRVLRSDGSLGGYLGGLEAKSLLLELESTSGG